MKTKLCKILAFILVSVMAMSVVSCSDEIDMTGKMTLVLGGDAKETYYVTVDEISGNNGLLSLFKHLGIEYEIESGEFIKVGPLRYSSGDGEHIRIYTSVKSDAAADPFTLDYDGQTLESIGVDFKDVTIAEGVVIYVGILRYK